MTVIGSYSISKANLLIECEDERLSEKVIGAIYNYFFTSDHGGSFPDSHNITLRFKNNDFSAKVPQTAQELYISSSLRVLRDGDFCYLVSGDSLFRIDLGNRIGIGLLDSNFWKKSLKSKQEFLMLSLLWLLRPHGLYALHANGVAKDEIGVLIAGSSGSGKSTLSLGLIRQGWRYLSDDITLLNHNQDEIEAMAFQKGFSFDSYLANRYPELDRPPEAGLLNGQKRCLDIGALYPDRFQSSCLPKVLIFPKIASQEKSQLIPIDKTRALILLIENSGCIMVDKEIVVKQMEVLKRFVYQTSSYQLFAGQDLFKEPEKFSEILSRVIEKI
jgi:HPr serine kinase-like protein